MRKDSKINPAWYECPKGSGGVHYWFRYGGGAECRNCGLRLNQWQAAEVFVDNNEDP